MRGLSLTKVPTSMRADAGRVWLDGLPGSVTAGDLWLLSWDGEALALVVVRRVREDYIVAWPVTLPDEPAFPPAVLVDSEALGSRLAVWPQASTGVGMHLLHRRLGRLMSERTMELVDRYSRGVGESPLVSPPDSVDDAVRERFASDLLGNFEAICFHQWPTDQVGDAALDLDFMSQRGVTAQEVSEILGTTPPDTLALLRQQRAPTVDEVSRLAAAWGVAPEQFLGRARSDSVAELVRPTYKDSLLGVASLLGLSEGEARLAVQREFDLAARTSRRSDSVPVRMNAALARLMEGMGDTSGPN